MDENEFLNNIDYRHKPTIKLVNNEYMEFDNVNQMIDYYNKMKNDGVKNFIVTINIYNFAEIIVSNIELTIKNGKYDYIIRTKVQDLLCNNIAENKYKTFMKTKVYDYFDVIEKHLQIVYEDTDEKIIPVSKNTNIKKVSLFSKCMVIFK